MRVRASLQQLGQGRPALLSFGLQLGAWLVAAFGCAAMGLGASLAVPLTTGLLAWLLALGCRMPSWWCWINALFVPLIALAQLAELPAGLWLIGFLLLLLIFWRTDASRVPLYLTNRDTADTIDTLVHDQVRTFYDLGCGDARLLRILARRHPKVQFVGFEHAPLTWLWARVGSARTPNLSVRLGSFWRVDLRDVDLVYAFLSPAPMPRLWQKACAEMGPRALLVSNSFAVPDVVPVRELHVADRRATQLYCYQPAAQRASPAPPASGYANGHD